MKPMYFIIAAILILVAVVGSFLLIRSKNQNQAPKQPVEATPYEQTGEQTGQQQKLLEMSTSPYGPGNSDPPGVKTKTTLFRSGRIESQEISYRLEGDSYKPVPATTATSNLQAEAVAKIEDIIKQLMGKDCAKLPNNRSISLDIYWQNQTKTINSPNCDKEIIEITRLLNQ